MLLASIRRLAYRARWYLAYWRLPFPKTRAELTLDEPRIEQELAASPLPSQNFSIDVSHYGEWMKAADYPSHYPAYYPDNLPEKSLEHYLAAQFLDLRPGQVYIDIASQNGVAANLYERVYGVKAYLQDMDFPSGVHGRQIGGDAANLPLEDGFADALALHCSFDHFEGDTDIRFIREVGRVLRPGGKCVIVPLYLRHEPAIHTNPAMVFSPPVEFDAGVIKHATRTWYNRFGRFYSIGTLTERIWANRGDLEIQIVQIKNFRDVHPTCYARYLALLTKPL